MDAVYPSFLDQHPDVVQKTKVALSNYVNGLVGTLAGPSLGPGNDLAVLLRPELQVKIDADGWPILRPTAWEDLRNQDLELVVRHYLKKQYSTVNSYVSLDLLTDTTSRAGNRFPI